MIQQTDPFIIEDITQLSIEDLKKWELDDLLVYINEIKDKNTIIIYLINIIKQVGAESNLLKYLHKFESLSDLKNQLNLIWRMIEENYLPLDDILTDEIYKMTKEIGRLSYTDLIKINLLETSNKKVDYDTSKSKYIDSKEHMDLLSAKICKLYTQTNCIRKNQKEAKEEFKEVLIELKSTPQVGTNIGLGDMFERYMIDTGTRAGLIDPREANKKLRDINNAKVTRFHEKQEKGES